RGDHGQDDVDHRPDDDDVAGGTDARALPERDPHQQYRRAHDDRPDPDRDPGPAGQALVQHVPGIEDEPAQYQQRVADAVQDQARQEMDQAPRQPGAAPPGGGPGAPPSRSAGGGLTSRRAGRPSFNAVPPAAVVRSGLAN